jgi:hypothetical protein
MPEREERCNDRFRVASLALDGCSVRVHHVPVTRHNSTESGEKTRLYNHMENIMQVLTLEMVQEAARKAYHDGKLTAQHSDPWLRLCRYQIDDYHCAVGAALSAETLKDLLGPNHNTQSVSALESCGFIRIAALSEREAIRDIQVAHDDWASSERGRPTIPDNPRKAAFLAKIGLPQEA